MKCLNEVVRNTVEAMLLSGKVTCEIVCETGVSAPTIGKIRKELIRNGKGGLWHSDEYLDAKGFA